MNFQKNIRRRETSCVPCQKNAWLEYFILHTGQHHSYNIDRVFFERLGLPETRYNLEMGSGRMGEQTGRMMAGIRACWGAVTSVDRVGNMEPMV